MVLDTSALVAVLLREDGHERLLDTMAAAASLVIGGPTVAELALVLAHKLGRDPVSLIERVLERFEIQVLPFDREHARDALAAYLRFGKGRHRAQLNFGDCLTYAVAARAGEPLLCVGDDFPATDLLLA